MFDKSFNDMYYRGHHEEVKKDKQFLKESREFLHICLVNGERLLGDDFQEGVFAARVSLVLAGMDPNSPPDSLLGELPPV